MQESLEDGLQFYEDALEQSGGPFLLGDTFTLADAHLLPFMTRLLVSLRHFKNYELAPQLFQKLVAWHQECMQRPTVQAATPSEERIIEVYQKFVQIDYSFGGLNANKKA